MDIAAVAARAPVMLDAAQLRHAIDAGARFGVSPGCTTALAPAVKSAAAPLADVRFCPTGGVGIDTAPAYLALANVACVGGSWVAPRDAVAAGDWSRIEHLASQAAALKGS